MSSPLGFYFDASACSGCKACEIACMDRSGLELRAALAARLRAQRRRLDAVRAVRGSSDVFAFHLSIACNHCEAPICLEGCPSRAITQREDGIVLLDQDKCLGCGYCSWLCPYSAPQWDERSAHDGQVRLLRGPTGRWERSRSASRPVRCGRWTPWRRWMRWRRSTASRRVRPTVQPLPDRRSSPGPALLAAPPRANRLAQRSNPAPRFGHRQPRGLRELPLVVFTVLSQWAAGSLLLSLLHPGSSGHGNEERHRCSYPSPPC